MKMTSTTRTNTTSLAAVLLVTWMAVASNAFMGGPQLKCHVSSENNMERRAGYHPSHRFVSLFSQAEEKLRRAAEYGDIDTVRELLKDGSINEDSYDSSGWVALHNACYFNHRDIAELLLDHGASIERRTPNGETPLLLACQTEDDIESIFTVKLLLGRGADVNAQDSVYYNNCLHNACYHCTSETREETVKELLAHGADPNAKNNEGKTPIDKARQYGKFSIIRVFKKHLAKQEEEKNKITADASSAVLPSNSGTLYEKEQLKSEFSDFVDCHLQYRIQIILDEKLGSTERELRECLAESLRNKIKESVTEFFSSFD